MENLAQRGYFIKLLGLYVTSITTTSILYSAAFGKVKDLSKKCVEFTSRVSACYAIQ